MARAPKDSRESLLSADFNPHIHTAADDDPFPFALHSFKQQRGTIFDYGVAPACNGPCGGQWLPEGALLFTATDGNGNLTYVAAYTDPTGDPVHECGTKPEAKHPHATASGKIGYATHEYLAHLRERAVHQDVNPDG